MVHPRTHLTPTWPGAVIAAALALACATAGPPNPTVEPPAAGTESLAPAPTSSADPPPTAPSGAAPASVPTVERLRWTRELERPVVSLGLGKRRLAAIAASEHGARDVWLSDGKAWKLVALPERLVAKEGERDDARIFFGRDDQPRILGSRSEGAAPRPLYLRYRPPAGWVAERNETGRLLGPPPSALFGVLGHDDPEVVCKLGDTCIIKRLTGWSNVGSPAAVMRVELAGGLAIAFATRSLMRLEQSGFVAVGGEAPFGQPGGATVDSTGAAWVSEPGTSTLHRFDGQRWAAHPSPLRSPRGLWAASASDVWLAGDDGAAHYDGHAWRKIVGPEGPLSEVFGRDGDDVWLAGETGVWRGSP